MDDKLKNTENDAQIIREEDLSAYRAKGIYTVSYTHLRAHET